MSTTSQPLAPADPAVVAGRPAELTVAAVCRLLRLAPTAIPLLADRGDLRVTLPAAPGYCPQLADARVTWIRRSLTADVGLLTTLRRAHPPDRPDSHYWRATALGGILRVLHR